MSLAALQDSATPRLDEAARALRLGVPLLQQTPAAPHGRQRSSAPPSRDPLSPATLSTGSPPAALRLYSVWEDVLGGPESPLGLASDRAQPHPQAQAQVTMLSRAATGSQPASEGATAVSSVELGRRHHESRVPVDPPFSSPASSSAELLEPRWPDAEASPRRLPVVVYR